MKKTNNKFLDIINEQRSKKKAKKFNGTFLEYLSLVKDNPEIAQLAHKRLYNIINEQGITALEESDSRCRRLFGGNETKTYDYFP